MTNEISRFSIMRDVKDELCSHVMLRYVTVQYLASSLFILSYVLLQVAQNSFQHLDWMGFYNHSLSIDAAIMAFKKPQNHW